MSWNQRVNKNIPAQNIIKRTFLNEKLVQIMIPGHCREVGVKKVNFKLTEEDIIRELSGKKWYTATKYLVLHNSDDYAVCKITKKDGFELFRELIDIDVISLPSETKYVEDPQVDVLNPSKLTARAEDLFESNGVKTVIVKGEFDHISFVSGERRRQVTVLETVPPEPPKLLRLAERVVSDGKLKKPIKLVPEFIKVNEMAENAAADTIVFPCKTSKLNAVGKKTLYLDQLPPLEELGGKVVLLGCSLSDRIFKSHYHRKPELVNICPADIVKNGYLKNYNNPILLKCCKLKEEYEIENNLIKVPWGTTTRIIEDALNDYFERENSGNQGG